ncbi:hypothetical protein MY11210_008986 [Beauveria gryllotalpidicola]
MARTIVIDSDDSHGESDDSEARENVFFDEEALESAELTENESESDEEESGSDEEESGSDEEEMDPFPFTRLPPELRLRVWTLFCPELLGAPRVLDFNIQDSVSPTRTSPCKVIGPGLCLEDQTRALRCVLATNQQSRAFAKERFPDELRLESDDGDELTLCVNLKADVAMLDQAPDFSYQDVATTVRVNFDGFSESLINLALPLHDYSLYDRETDVSSWLREFGSLQRLFLYTEDDTLGGRRLKDDALRWCAAPHARQYYMETFEKEPGYGENYTCVICWPDPVRSPSFTKAHVPKWHTKFLFRSQENAFEEAGVNLFPMVQFNTEQALERYANFVATDHLPFKVYGTNEEGSDADSYEEETDEEEDYQLNLPNAYESDGIDDDEPEIFYDSDDVHFDDTDSDGSGRDDAPRNPFSSPEPSEAEGGPPVRGRKRHVIADSDDEDEQEPSSRPAKRKRLHVVEDSDEEQSVAEAGEPQVISSDSDKGPTKRRKVNIIDSDSESDDGAEHDGQPQRISLKDRLQLGSRNGRGPSDEEDGEEEDDCEDDEEEDDDDDDDDDEDGDEDGLIDNMAAESGEDDDEEEDEEDE